MTDASGQRQRAEALYGSLTCTTYREGYQDPDNDIGIIEQALTTARQEALREAARQTCMYCSGNARGYTLGVAGPNSAGNYTHEVPEDSWAKEGVLCKATSIWSLIYYEDRLASEGG